MLAPIHDAVDVILLLLTLRYKVLFRGDAWYWKRHLTGCREGPWEKVNQFVDWAISWRINPPRFRRDCFVLCPSAMTPQLSSPPLGTFHISNVVLGPSTLVCTYTLCAHSSSVVGSVHWVSLQTTNTRRRRNHLHQPVSGHLFLFVSVYCSSVSLSTCVEHIYGQRSALYCFANFYFGDNNIYLTSFPTLTSTVQHRGWNEPVLYTAALFLVWTRLHLCFI